LDSFHFSGTHLSTHRFLHSVLCPRWWGLEIVVPRCRPSCQGAFSKLLFALFVPLKRSRTKNWCIRVFRRRASKQGPLTIDATPRFAWNQTPQGTNKVRGRKRVKRIILLLNATRHCCCSAGSMPKCCLQTQPVAGGMQSWSRILQG